MEREKGMCSGQDRDIGVSAGLEGLIAFGGTTAFRRCAELRRLGSFCVTRQCVTTLAAKYCGSVFQTLRRDFEVQCSREVSGQAHDQ